MKKRVKLFLIGIGMAAAAFCMVRCGIGTGGVVSVKANVPYAGSQAQDDSSNYMNLVKTSAVDKEKSYTFVWMSDTQFYSESTPEVYQSMTRWIAENADDRNIKFVFHTGDVVDQGNDIRQWNNADQAMGYLDGKVSYSILAGNHDLVDSENRYENFVTYFGADRFSGQNTSGNTIWFYHDGEASAQIINTGSQNYLVFALGVWPDEEMILWTDTVLKLHPEIPAILTTHDYMNKDGTRSDMGNRLFDEIVRTNPNVHMILCGHKHNAEYRWDKLDDNQDGVADRTVHQLLADYQETPNGGNGFMRLLTIDENKKRLLVSTYSPYLDQYDCFKQAKYPGKDHFEIDISDWF